MRWCDGPLLGFDLETTGVDPMSDLPVQVALVWTTPRSARSDCFIVNPGSEIPAAAVAVHGITTEQARAVGCPLEVAIRWVHNTLRHAIRERVPIVAMNASFDITIAECLFASVGLSPLQWSGVLDPLVMDWHCDRLREGKRRLDALCRTYGVRLGTAHHAASDAKAAVVLTRIIGDLYPECGRMPVDELTLRQARWHHEWAVAYDRSRQEQGLEPLRSEEFLWPVRRPATFAEEAAAELARSV